MKFSFFGLVLSLIYVAVSYLYKSNITVLYSYLGYNFEFNLEKILISIVTFLIFIIILNKLYLSNDFVFALSIMFFIFSTIPTLVYYGMSDGLYLPIVGHLSFYSFNYILSTFNLKVTRVNVPNKHLKVFIYTFFFFGVLLFFATFKLNFNIGVGIEDVYDQRDKYNLAGNVLTKYLYSTFANVFCPFLIFYGFQNKNKLLAFAGVLFCLYLGLVSGLKTTFLNLLFVLLFFVLRGGLRVKMLTFVGSILGFLMLAIFLNVKTPLNVVNDLLVRRTMFTNPIITNGFFHVFNDKMMFLQHSVFRSFSGFNEIYPTYQVGYYLFGDSDINANTGFIADGYMNFGFFGMIFYTMLMALIIFYIKSIKIREEYVGIYCIMIISSIEMEFTVMLVTHGLIFLLFLTTFIFEKSSN